MHPYGVDNRSFEATLCSFSVQLLSIRLVYIIFHSTSEHAYISVIGSDDRNITMFDVSFTRKSASSFFAAYDALCEEGTATSVCKALDEIADVAVPGILILNLCLTAL